MGPRNDAVVPTMATKKSVLMVIASPSLLPRIPPSSVSNV